MARKHSVDEVLKALKKKNDCNVFGGTIKVLKSKIYSKEKNELIDNPHKIHDLGNSSWGRIDYLVNHCGYSLLQVDKF